MGKSAFGNKYNLSSGYVYYKELEGDDSYPGLYEVINRQIKDVTTRTDSKKINSSKIWQQAYAELAKEQKLIYKIFGEKLNINLEDRDSARQLIETYNTYFNLKQVFNRNITTIKNSNLKPVYSNYQTYFEKVLINRLNDFLLNANFQIKSNYITKAIQDKTDSWYKQNIDNIILESITEMFNAKPEYYQQMGIYSEEEQKAYEEIVEYLNNSKNNNSFVSQVRDSLKLDQVGDMIKGDLKASREEQKITLKGDLSKKIKGHIYAKGNRGGEMEELVSNLINSYLGQAFKDNRTTFHTGQSGIKADNIYTFGLNSSKVEELLQSKGKVSRDRNITMIDSLQNELNKVKGGFIVYENDKNYIPSSEKQAEKISAATYIDDLLTRINFKEKQLTGAMLQIGEGAISDGGELSDNISHILAQHIAYFLFDDFHSIGEKTTNSIHIFRLGGIVITLSFFLSLYAKAIDSVNGEDMGLLSSYASVKLKAPSILYGGKKAKNAKEAQERWESQAIYARKNTQITVKFLKDFRNIVQEYGF